MKTAAVAAFALFAAQASAFAPSTPSPARPSFALSDTAATAADAAPAEVDSNFDDVNLVRVLGLQRLKNIQRRHRRELNARIKNFDVVQDGEGEWVEATEEQSAAMKAEANAAKPKTKPFKRPSKKTSASA
eukprot:CAMPEP_0183308314 /NCGR_PEP_ID=MMETSP0160_2-20130417/21246_1 /TAXON_ID=2839 ORGANISM="Odontella Sinensis, Strain Grunow 1884" /NCGR_SAMPLE_ID=MMETSP0160_2 /ASSEMBLY_ACC=CAM_ASM_000250 /LENGTH=130 /DNA_ID=CAMNT_0025472123 /DNA_START=57 /DNA_END=449 /DNA_ORIENTATION=+